MAIIMEATLKKFQKSSDFLYFLSFQGRRPFPINFLQLEPNALIPKQPYTSRYKKLGPDSLSELKAGGKPSTWFPPGGLVEPKNGIPQNLPENKNYRRAEILKSIASGL